MAPYSLRIAKHDAGDELIGSHDMYMPVCRECFVFKTKQMQDRKAQAEGNVLKEIRFDQENETMISIEKSSESKQTSSTHGLTDSDEKEGTPGNPVKTPSEFLE